MIQMVPLSIAKQSLSKLVADIVRNENEVIISRNGKPSAVLLSFQEYECWKETQEIMSDPETMKEIKKNLLAIQKGQFKTYDSVEELFGPEIK